MTLPDKNHTPEECRTSLEAAREKIRAGFSVKFWTTVAAYWEQQLVHAESRAGGASEAA
jgi:hypothetical protein